MKFFSVKIRTRIFLTYLIISTICFYYPFRWVLDTMRTRYLEAVEDPLVDQAEILAAMVGAQMTAGDFAVERWANIFARSYQKELRAQIYDLEKRAVDILVYLTDDAGTVLFHSTDPDQVGADFSSWRDVSLTLAGSYGARASRGGVVADDAMVMYVGAPIMVNNQVAGVLSVGKPTTNISWFVEHAKLKVLLLALLALGLNALFGFLAARWLTQPINRLTAYARRIKSGERPPFPQLGSSEIGAMGRAFEEMQEALEGKRYVETYIQHLTHEIKSPISAIQGAAELLQEPMDDEQRHRFLGNIEREAHRMQAVVERMLELAALEKSENIDESRVGRGGCTYRWGRGAGRTGGRRQGVELCHIGCPRREDIRRPVTAPPGAGQPAPEQCGLQPPRRRHCRFMYGDGISLSPARCRSGAGYCRVCQRAGI
jgi:two-component system sensor histidine kinase CreC